MPKLSVYVPDELWGRACQADPLANPSQLVQRSLGYLLDGRSPESPAVTVPEGAAEKIKSLRDHFAAQAHAEYQAGYAGALDVAEQIPWFVLEDFANSKFDVRRWIEKWSRSAAEAAQHHSPAGWIYAVAKTLGTLADPIGHDQFSFRPTRACVRGFGDALRLVWEAVDLDTLGLTSDGATGTRSDE